MGKKFGAGSGAGPSGALGRIDRAEAQVEENDNNRHEECHGIPLRSSDLAHRSDLAHHGSTLKQT